MSHFGLQYANIKLYERAKSLNKLKVPIDCLERNKNFFGKTGCTETVALRCSVKKVFRKISQNSQENTCAGISFLIRFQASWWLLRCIEITTFALRLYVSIGKFLKPGFLGSPFSNLEFTCSHLVSYLNDCSFK